MRSILPWGSNVVFVFDVLIWKTLASERQILSYVMVPEKTRSQVLGAHFIGISVSSGWVWYQQLTSQEAPGAAYLVKRHFLLLSLLINILQDLLNPLIFFLFQEWTSSITKHRILVIFEELEWIQKYKTIEVGSSPHRSSPHSHQMSLCPGRNCAT